MHYVFIISGVRATYPRLRFDQLITLGWCSILPITLAFFFLVPSILITFSLNSPPLLSCTLALIFFAPRLIDKPETTIVEYSKSRESSFEIPTPILPINFSPWFLTFRTFSTEPRKIFVYTRSNDLFIYPSSSECAKALKVSRTTIRTAIKKAQPYKNYFFSLIPLEPKFLQNLGFLVTQVNNCTALVPFGKYLTSNVKLGIFSKLINNIITFPPYQYSVIIGLLLSDGWLVFSHSRSKNARLGFKQGMTNSPYFWFVFTILSPYCSSYPQLTSSVRNNKRSFGLQLQTRSLLCFTELYLLFYVKGVKIIPTDIYNLLTLIALAHWIMGDGLKTDKGLRISTDSFTIKDVVKLMNVLMIRYELECTLHFHRPTHPRIYIRTKSMPLLQSIVLPHMHSSMLYKIHL